MSEIDIGVRVRVSIKNLEEYSQAAHVMNHATGIVEEKSNNLPLRWLVRFNQPISREPKSFSPSPWRAFWFPPEDLEIER